jgi:membrane associated rhomboid family serine protease
MRDPRPQRWSLTTILLVSLVVCYILQQILPQYDNLFALSLNGLKHRYYWQLLTFQFMHGSLLHIVGNMFCLYFFGRAIEEMFGPAKMLKLYLLSGIIGGLCQVALALLLPKEFAISVVGASAGIFGLIAAFACTVPDQPITMLILFFLPLSFKAIWFLAFEAGISVIGLFTGIFNHGEIGIAHAAHLGGMLTGILFVKASGWIGQAGAIWQPPRRRTERELVRAHAQRGYQKTGSSGEDLPSAEFISRQVDPILEKISAQGIHSLTERERQILEAARSKMAKR